MRARGEIIGNMPEIAFKMEIIRGKISSGIQPLYPWHATRGRFPSLPALEIRFIHPD